MKKITLYSILLMLTACAPKTETKMAYDTSARKVTVYTTADSTSLRLSVTDTLTFSDFGQPLETQPCIFIDPKHQFQTFMGIGGALTDASAETFYKLPKEKQQEVLDAYFNPEKGIGYTLARTNIHACDFSSDSYTYVTEGDTTLASFSVEHDKKFRIPFIKESIAAAGGKLTLFASPWSPPAWMKNTNDILHGGKLLPKYYQAWSDYFVKFINTYEKEGIPIWGITVQNEPMAKQTWESCIFTAEEERDFIKNNLGPTMQKAGLSDKKIVAWDHNRDLIFQRANTILSDPEAAKYVWGIGYHWYENWTGGNMYDNVRRVKEVFPDKHLLFTEGCADTYRAEKVSEWKYGEMYGTSMVQDFNNGVEGWTDWNVLLDETGGPNHVGNFCFAPLHGDRKTGALTYVNSYYYIGHFSKFIRPGAKRISASSSRAQLLTTAFQNEDGSLAVVVLNTTSQKLPYRLWIDGKAAETVSLPRSIMTLVVK